MGERRRNPLDEAKSNLPFYAGRNAGDKDTCASLEDWLSLLEEITGSGLWDDSGRVQLARERLRGEALGSWWLWRRDNRTNSWASLADTLETDAWLFALRAHGNLQVSQSPPACRGVHVIFLS